MLRNLTISPELDKEDWDPDVITRMIIIAPGAHVSESEIVNELHMLDLPLTIKNTCYGSMVSGKTKDVFEAIREIRKLDPNHIFTKERGFAPGDRTKKSKFSSYSSPFLVLTFTFLSFPLTSITSLFTLTSKLNLALRLSGV